MHLRRDRNPYVTQALARGSGALPPKQKLCAFDSRRERSKPRESAGVDTRLSSGGEGFDFPTRRYGSEPDFSARDVLAACLSATQEGSVQLRAGALSRCFRAQPQKRRSKTYDVSIWRSVLSAKRHQRGSIPRHVSPLSLLDSAAPSKRVRAGSTPAESTSFRSASGKAA